MTDHRFVCRELVELATEYLELALPEQERESFEQHLRTCIDCQHYLTQFQLSIRATATLRGQALGDEQRAELRNLYQRWQADQLDHG